MTLLKPRTKTVPVYSGDDLETLGDLSRAAQRARQAADDAAAEAAQTSAPRYGDDAADSAPDPKVAAAEQAAKDAEDAYDAKVDESAQRALVFEVQHIRRDHFRDLMAEHPPREGDPEDAPFGVNVRTFAQPFLEFTRDGYATVAHVFIGDRELPPQEWQAELGNMSDGDYDRIFATAFWLNRAPGGDPKETRFSTESQTSTET